EPSARRTYESEHLRNAGANFLNKNSGTSVSAESPSQPLCPFLALFFAVAPWSGRRRRRERIDQADFRRKERRRQVRIAHRHLQRLMAEQLGDAAERDTNSDSFVVPSFFSIVLAVHRLSMRSHRSPSNGRTRP